MIIYVGDSRKNIIERISMNHCSGNVEASTLRRHIAKGMGFDIKTSKRPSGSTKVRIDLPNPRDGEERVSDYVRSGWWKFIISESAEEAQDFQWYAIDKLNPILNVNRQNWKIENASRYGALLKKLVESETLRCNQIRGRPTGAGVYVFYHDRLPSEKKEIKIMTKPKTYVELIKEAAHHLDRTQGTFTRIDIKRYILEQYPDFSLNDDSLNPGIQGVTVNAPGGAPNLDERGFLERIKRGLYRLKK